MKPEDLARCDDGAGTGFDARSGPSAGLREYAVADEDLRKASRRAEREACRAPRPALRASARHDAGRNVFASASSCHIHSFISEGDVETMPSMR